MYLRIFALINFILIICSAADAGNLSSADSMPFIYPEGTIGNTNPSFIWFDKYLDKDDNTVKYKISLKSEKDQEIKPFLIIPEVYNNNYYFFKYPLTLTADRYTYTIERFAGDKASDAKYFHGLKYPISGSFELDPAQKGKEEDLPPGKLIEYLKLEKENRLQNGYNFIFYGSASLGSFGIGYLFYKVFEFGIISKIIYTVAFISSATGICAAGYYGYNYISEGNEMQKIVDIGSNVSINGKVSAANAAVDFRLRY